MTAGGAADRLLSDDELVALFEQLRRDGYRLVPQQLDAAMRILRHARSGAPDGTPASRLAFALTPIFAKTPSEQADLYRRLAALRGPAVLGRVEPPDPAPAGGLPEVVRHGRVWPVVAVAAGLLGAWLLVAWWFGSAPEPVVELPPTPVIPRAGDPPLRPETITTVFLETSPAYWWIKWGLIGLPLVPFGCWLVLRWRWRQLWLRRGRSEADLDPLDLGHRPAGTALFADPDLARTAQQWRRFRRLPTRDLDADRTIDATLAQAGLFSAVFRTRPVSPEYVVLIEEETRHDHLARLADVAADRFAAEGVPIERYYYNGGIEHLRQPGGGPAPLSLGELDARSPHRSLIIAGSGADLFAPLSARLEPRTAQALEAWPHRAFLSQRPVAAWSDRELALLDSGMALATASRSGMRALGNHLSDDRDMGGGRLLEGVLLDRGGAPAARVDEAGPSLEELVAALRLRLRTAITAQPADPDAASGAPDPARARLGEALALLDAGEDVAAALQLVDLARELAGAAAFDAPLLVDAIRRRLASLDIPVSPLLDEPAASMRSQAPETPSPVAAPADADIFIAAARQERHRVELIARKLGDVGLRAWSEDGIPLEDGFKEEFYRRVDSSRAILACWTGAGWSYGFLSSAADAGRSRDCLISCTLDAGPAPEPFDDLETVDLSDWDGEDDHPGWRKVLGAVRKRIQPEPSLPIDGDQVRLGLAVRKALLACGIEDADDTAIAILVGAARLAPTAADPMLSASRIFCALLSVGQRTSDTPGGNVWCAALARVVAAEPHWRSAAKRIEALFHEDGVDGAMDRLRSGFSESVKGILQRACRSEPGTGRLIGDRIVPEVLTYRGGELSRRLREWGGDPDALWSAVQTEAATPLGGPSSEGTSEQLSPLTIFRDIDAPWCPEMVVVPAGRFQMGSAETEKGSHIDQGPQHEVVIERPFALGRYPVTFAEYDRFCTVTRREKPGDAGWGRDRRPVINVPWEEATAYCQWLSSETGKRYRLPSEAEWEYACRAGTTGAYWWGGEFDATKANAAGKVGRTSEVGSYAENPWGLCDMHGNVWEWCADTWHGTYQGAPADGSPWVDEKDSARRVVRGGSWDSNPEVARSAIRGRNEPVGRLSDLGFRVSRMLTP